MRSCHFAFTALIFSLSLALRSCFSSGVIQGLKRSVTLRSLRGACFSIISDRVRDSIPHELIIAKLHAYGFDENALVLIHSYLKKRKQSVRINNVYSSFQHIVSGVPQGSVLGPIIFNFYINDLFFFIKQASLYNYADDNTLACFSRSLLKLVEVLEEEAGNALSWLD